MKQSDIQSKEREKEKKREDIHIEYLIDHEASSSRICVRCGARLDEDENFCPECGEAYGGVFCPECGTLNHGSFCSNCNEPLDDKAFEAVRKARKDPRFIEALHIAEELLAIEEEIRKLTGGDLSGIDFSGNAPGGKTLDTTSRLTEVDRKLLDRYKDLLGGKVVKPAVSKETQKPAPVDKSGGAPADGGFSIKAISLNDAITRYKAVAKQLEAKLNSMLPEPTATPEEQRNFFSARKISSVKWIAEQAWVCNFCGYHHSQPSECSKPWMGGTWVIDMVKGGKQTSTYYD